MFDIKTVGGYRASATDPNGHPAGLAADFMVPLNAAGRAQGDRLAAYAKTNASKARHRLHHLVPAHLVGRTRLRGLAADGGPGERHGEPPRPRAHQRQARRLRPAGWPRGRILRRGGLPGARAVHRHRQPQLARDRPLLVQLAHRHRLLRPLRNHRLRRPCRHHRDRHHPGVGRPAGWSRSPPAPGL
ncbi:hypothetical protein [Nocardioides convexus]|uniref:hypothetical protein n=1 Tax=Nocardioides convexus TaxID=2712224 RepID=UPI0024185B10|nr:hypothetical protein [Nocardioides convexus]